MSFFQFFVWGAWLTTLGTYGFQFKGWGDFAIVFSTLGIASIVMPPIVGIIADKWMNAEKLYGLLHLFYGITFFFIPTIQDSSTFFWVTLLGMAFYMPTISLSNSLSYTVLVNKGYEPVKDFPLIRVFGTIGFIVAMWITNLFSDPTSPWLFAKNIGEKFASVTGNPINTNQFYFAAIGAVLLGLYAFSLPKCPPLRLINKDASLSQKLGLDAFKLFGDRKMAIFFIFSFFLGAALQLTNMYGDAFLKSYGDNPAYATSTVVEYSTIIISISQISETLFIISIPFFLRKFGIKKVILFSMFAWVLRFGLFGIGGPDGFGLTLIILSNIIYGMAFDFFNISGSLFVETSTPSKIRSAAQGLFMMMSNGFGAIFGSVVSGYLMQHYFTLESGATNWQGMWLTFAAYALVIAVLFLILFKHKHNPKEVEVVSH